MTNIKTPEENIKDLELKLAEKNKFIHELELEIKALRDMYNAIKDTW